MLHFGKILHPTDYSNPSEYALGLACSLAQDHEGRLLILHVVTTLGPDLVPAGEAATLLEPEDYQKKLWDDLRRIQPGDPAIHFEHHLAQGDPAQEIIRLATDQAVDIIVMGTHGRKGLPRLFLGSVAEEVVRKAPCPVLTVKNPPSFSSV